MSLDGLFHLFGWIVLAGIFCLVSVGLFLLIRVRRHSVKRGYSLRIFVFIVTMLYLLLFTVIALLCVYKFSVFSPGIWTLWAGALLVLGEIVFFSWYVYRDIELAVVKKRPLIAAAPGCENAAIEPENTEERISRQLSELFEKQHIYREFGLRIEDVATRIGTNRTYLSSVLNNKYGYNFLRFVNHYRLDEAKELLLSTVWPVRQIAEKVGYKNINTFNSCFRGRFGLSPKQWRLNHMGHEAHDL